MPETSSIKLLSAVQNFQVMTEVLDEKIERNLSLETYNLSIESELPKKKTKKAHKNASETADDKAIFSAEDNFRVQVFNVVIDQINLMATRCSD